ncbi:phage tail tape measure protein [Bifidobacterium vansinderenii]|uniref:Phage tail tape measure protein n=1 Tax=Bifidobacterium vansinderenii TaxID=1984871 RepID=A0A229W0U8_9BIFI|nr:phage tail tape measure protein [Bifidobacterium vansinderenii]OXN01488.1 phage tail tape measure protein [Bifidobacterium vansinderenii]
MALNENIMIRLMADTSNYTTKMAAASKQAQQFGTALEKPMTTQEKLAAGATKAGLAIGAVSAAIGVAAVTTFAQFDAAMSTVQANTGASAKEMDQLRQAAIDAGANTVYSASEAADAINELGKAGMSTSDILAGGLTGALNLAASDGMQVAEAAELMSSAMAQFNLTGSDAGRVADALAAGAGKAQGSARDLGYALQQSGMVANSFGIGMEETVGTLTAFANAGMIGSDAGTSLKTMLIALANPSDKAAALMDELGINAYDAQGNFIGLSALAGQLQAQLGGLTQEQRNQALATIFGSDAIRSANVLYNEGADGISEWTDAVADSGFAAEQAAAKNNNLKGDLENLSGSVESMLITIGSGADGPLRSMVQTIDMLVDAFSDLPAPVQQGTVMFGLMVGATAGLHQMFGDLASSSSQTSRSLGLMLDPVQRLNAAAPQLSSGFRQLASAATGGGAGIQSLSGTASRAQAAMGGLKSIGSGVVSLLGGPWGIALTVAGAALTAWASKARQAKQDAQQLQSALENASDVGETMVHMTQQIDFSWLDRMQTGSSNMSELLDKAGISMETFVRAAQGSKDAINEVNEALKNMNAEGGDSSMTPAATKIRDSLNELSEAYGTATKGAAESKEATDALSSSSGEASDAQSQLASSATETADAESILTDAMGATEDAVSETAGAWGEVISAMETYYGFSLNASDALIAMHSAFDKATEAARENGATLDLNTEKGRNNQSALNDVAQSALKAAQAQAENGASMDDINATLDDAHNRYVEAAMAMGMTPGAAAAAADAAGLTSEAFQKLADRVGMVPDDKNIKVTLTDEASRKFDELKLRIEATPDGKNVVISGDNTTAMQAIAAVTDATIDPKTGTLNLDKSQYDIALALANGAKIDPKTGKLLGDNNDFWNKLAQANGWKIEEHTGVISGDNGPFYASKTAVDAVRIGGKSVSITAEDAATAIINAVDAKKISDKYFTIYARSNMSDLNGDASGNGRMGTYAHGGVIRRFAAGGYGGLVHGVGSGVSDSNLALVSRGEYVMTARAVDHYGVAAMDAINGMRWTPDTGVKYTVAQTRLPTNDSRLVESNRQVVDAINALHRDIGPTISAYAPRLGEREFNRLTWKANR